MAWRLGRERGQDVTSLANLSSAGLAFGMAVILGAALGYGATACSASSPFGFLRDSCSVWSPASSTCSAPQGCGASGIDDCRHRLNPLESP